MSSDFEPYEGVGKTDGPPGVPVAPSRTGMADRIRLIVLLIMLAIMVGIFLYDRQVRAQAEQTYDQVLALLGDDSSKADQNGDGVINDKELHQAIQRQPDVVKNLPNGKVETYRWRRGLPFLSYEMHVVYSGRLEPLLHSALLNQEPSERDLPPVTKVKVPRPEDLEGFVPPVPAAAGSSASGADGRGRRPSQQEGEGEEPEQSTQEKGSPSAGTEEGKATTQAPAGSGATGQEGTKEKPQTPETEKKPEAGTGRGA